MNQRSLFGQTELFEYNIFIVYVSIVEDSMTGSWKCVLHTINVGRLFGQPLLYSIDSLVKEETYASKTFIFTGWLLYSWLLNITNFLKTDYNLQKLSTILFLESLQTKIFWIVRLKFFNGFYKIYHVGLCIFQQCKTEFKNVLKIKNSNNMRFGKWWWSCFIFGKTQLLLWMRKFLWLKMIWWKK